MVYTKFSQEFQKINPMRVLPIQTGVNHRCQDLYIQNDIRTRCP